MMCCWLFFPILIADIRELINLDDVMEELGLGPNGGLMFCMEYPSLNLYYFFSLPFLYAFAMCIYL